MGENSLKDKLENKSSIIKKGEGEKHSAKGTSVTFKVDSTLSKEIGMYEIVLEAYKNGALLHYHRFIDETFIVIDGELTVLFGKQEKKVTSGDIVHVPRLTPHGFKNDSDKNVKFILLFNPGHKREEFFKSMSLIMKEPSFNECRLSELYKRYDNIPM